MKYIYFKNAALYPKVKEVLRMTNLIGVFNLDKIYLQTEDGEEGCEVEYAYEPTDTNDPRDVTIISLKVGEEMPTNLLRELETKLGLEFVYE